MATFYGDAGNNEFTSTPEADTYYGDEGSDAVFYSSNFLPGADESAEFGGFGISVNLSTGTGADGFGNTEYFHSIEEIYGTIYDDTVIGNDDDNYVNLRGGANYFDGGGGSDTITYNTEFTAFGEPGIYVDLSLGYGYLFGSLQTYVSVENVRGTQQDDTIIGSDADGYMMGLAGDDTLDGGGGIDMLRYDRDERYTNPFTDEKGLSGVTVNLATGEATDGYGDHDTISNFENVRGTIFGDSITGDSGSNHLIGMGGEDTIIGGAGNDTLEGGLNGPDGDTDTFVFASGDGMDTILDFEAGIDLLDLSAFADFVILAGRLLPSAIPDNVVAILAGTPKAASGFDILDSNGDGVLDHHDAAVDAVNGGHDMRIDFGAAYGGSAGQDTLLLVGVTELEADSLIF